VLGIGHSANVRKKRGIILAAVLAAVLGGLPLPALGQDQPELVYRGKHLSTWLEAFANPTTADPVRKDPDATDAVRHIGTNAIPTLLRMLWATAVSRLQTGAAGYAAN
jgi:hypothetical protein